MEKEGIVAFEMTLVTERMRNSRYGTMHGLGQVVLKPSERIGVGVGESKVISAARNRVMFFVNFFDPKRSCFFGDT